MGYRFLALACIIAILSCTCSAQAFSGLSARMTTRAISKNIELAFRPALHIKKEYKISDTAKLAMSQNESVLLALSGNKLLHVWDLKVGRERLRKKVDDTVQKISVNSDGTLALIEYDTYYTIWDLVENTIENRIPKEHYIASGIINRQAVLIDPEGNVTTKGLDGTTLSNVTLSSGRVESAAIFPSGIAIATKNKLTILTPNLSSETHFDLEGKKLLLAGNKEGVLVQTDSNLFFINRQLKNVSQINFKHKLKEIQMGTEKSSIAALDDEKLVLINTENLSATILPEKMNATCAVIDGQGQYMLGATDMGTITLWNITSNSKVASLIVTKDGWAIVDSEYRYDGNQRGLSALEWKDSTCSISVEQVTTKYEPALFANLLSTRSAELKKDAALTFPPDITGELTTNDSEIVLAINANQKGQSGISGLRVYRNNRVMQNFTYSEDIPSVSEQLHIPYDQSTVQVSAVVWNKDGIESNKTTWDIKNKSHALLNNKKTYILSIGIDDYANEQLKLKNAVADASSILTALSDKKSQLTQTRHKSIFNSQATRDNILAALYELQTVSPQDNVIIYLSGHGVRIDKTWYFLPANIVHLTRDDVVKTGISVQELEKVLARIPADQLLLVIDACQSGGVLAPIERFSGLKKLRSLARSTGIHILTATDGIQEAAEVSKLGHGLFTYTVLAGLNGLADCSNNNRISSDELQHFVSESLPYFSQKIANYTQYPMEYSEGVPFDLLKTTNQ